MNEQEYSEEIKINEVKLNIDNQYPFYERVASAIVIACILIGVFGIFSNIGYKHYNGKVIEASEVIYEEGVNCQDLTVKVQEKQMKLDKFEINGNGYYNGNPISFKIDKSSGRAVNERSSINSLVLWVVVSVIISEVTLEIIILIARIRKKREMEM